MLLPSSLLKKVSGPNRFWLGCPGSRPAASGLPRLVSRPAALPLPCGAGRASFSRASRVSRPSVLRTVMESTACSRCTLPCCGLKLLAAFVGARKACVLHGLDAPFREVLVVLELVGAGCFSTSSGGRRIGPRGSLEVVAPLPALAGHARGQVLPCSNPVPSAGLADTFLVALKKAPSAIWFLPYR